MNETQKAYENFKLNDRTVHPSLIQAIITVKSAAVHTMKELQLMDSQKADYILSACQNILSKNDMSPFITHPLQGGAGTSTHMNVNEVLAEHAMELSGHIITIDPLDDVNRFQSTNDIYPTALRIASIQWIRKLSKEVSKLQESLQQKENMFDSIKKMGRTQLQDALPITLGNEFGCYAQAISRDRWRIYKVEERLRQVNLGGTAVGTGSNANRKYTFRVIEHLRDITGIGLSRAEYPMDLTQNQDVFVEVSGLLKGLAVNLMKISNDLRLMNSSPYGEIHLKPLQKGSTIMPGKVNPVLPEMISQVAIQVMANDSAISIAAANGQFELNAFLPLIADNLLTSLELLTNGVSLFREKCIVPLTASEKGCEKHLHSVTSALTQLVPVIGYDLAEKISIECDGDLEKMHTLLKKHLTPKQQENLLNL
ncbi:lyase family protein [Anaerostipes faecalis]|uniref:lyase family protein n=1 Tax=Anaerostipes faecalis TaxID=2738446 RepID=UPI003F0737F8